jgi:hypothetical protein
MHAEWVLLIVPAGCEMWMDNQCGWPRAAAAQDSSFEADWPPCWYTRSLPLGKPNNQRVKVCRGQVLHTWVPCSPGVPGAAPGAIHRGSVLRTIVCTDSFDWLRQQPVFPRRCHLVTSLPDIGELQPPMQPEAYEAWFIATVRDLISRLSEHAVACFYQTDGRHSGANGGWLDKGFLCQLGAREAGATCLWHRVVCADRPGQIRGGRCGYARLLCFSKRLRCVSAGVDVLPDRGFMSYAGAAGEAACLAAVQYVVIAHNAASAPMSQMVQSGSQGGAQTDCATALPEEESDAPALVLDPFCGEGSVLAVANALSLDAIGIDLNRKRCGEATVRRPHEHVAGSSSTSRNACRSIKYWSAWPPRAARPVVSPPAPATSGERF